jgi:hypothetical protein
MTSTIAVRQSPTSSGARDNGVAAPAVSGRVVLFSARYHDAEMRALLMQCADIRADTVMRRINQMREPVK